MYRHLVNIFFDFKNKKIKNTRFCHILGANMYPKKHRKNPKNGLLAILAENNTANGSILSRFTDTKKKLFDFF